MKAGWTALVGTLILAGCATQEFTPVPIQRAELWRSPIADGPPGAGQLWPSDAPPIHARAAILIDARSGLTLYQKYADQRTQVASTQKLLTALLVLKRGNLDSRVVVAPQDTYVEPSKLGIRAGQTYSRRTLLSAMMVQSENDAAAALARDCFGTPVAFASVMNNTAWELGAHNSHFANPHGLPAHQYSTARDMARIAFRAYREPLLPPSNGQPVLQLCVCYRTAKDLGKHQQVAQAFANLQWYEDWLYQRSRPVLDLQRLGERSRSYPRSIRKQNKVYL